MTSNPEVLASFIVELLLFEVSLPICMLSHFRMTVMLILEFTVKYGLELATALYYQHKHCGCMIRKLHFTFVKLHLQKSELEIHHRQVHLLL